MTVMTTLMHTMCTKYFNLLLNEVLFLLQLEASTHYSWCDDV